VDKVYNNNYYEFSHTVLLLKSDLDVQQTAHWGFPYSTTSRLQIISGLGEQVDAGNY
jgi:hypothetical protein